MKNFKLLLTAAVLFAVGSAFTAAKTAHDQVYVDVNGIRTPIEEADGNCEEGGTYCKYTLDGDTPIPLDSGVHFEPNN